jgi:hypothetical protein
VIDMTAAAQELDVMIEMSAQLGRDWMVAFRERGGKVVSMRVGNDYVIDIERMVFDKPHGLLITGAPYDEVWTLPEYESTCKPYFASAFRAPVRLMPHLWSPMVLERAMARAPEGPAFAYVPGRKQWRVAIFEPNICLVKTSFIPMLGCEAAHRAQPRLIEKMWVYNSFQLKEKPLFVGFAQSLDIVQHGLATFEGRFPVYQAMPGKIDAVFAHHWENAQNYLCYEALYGGYPLVHNSHLVGGCGYGRVDMRIDANGQPWILEVNANPDIAPDAGLARMARVAGTEYGPLIRNICELALTRSRQLPNPDDWATAQRLSGVLSPRPEYDLFAVAEE